MLKENRPACQPFAGAERRPVTRKKILLADDVELFLELEKTFFRRESFELLIARTGQQAWDLTQAETPDLVFMDLFMPGMDGDAACRLIKQQPQTASIPVVMVTQGGGTTIWSAAVWPDAMTFCSSRSTAICSSPPPGACCKWSTAPNHWSWPGCRSAKARPPTNCCGIIP